MSEWDTGGTGLGAELRDLGRKLAYPPAPDLVPAVRARLAEERSTRRVWPRPRALAFAAAVLALLVVPVALSPSLRGAVAGWLGVDGVRIKVGRSSPTPAAADLDLGALVSLDEARESVSFRVLVPSSLGPPDEVFFGDTPPGGQVSLVYHPRAGVPSTGQPDVGVLVTQFRATLDGGFFKKVASAAQVEFTAVGTSEAYWIEGSHSFFYVDERGAVVEESVRLAANVLLWEQGGVTFRIESALPLERALSIARSLE
ncbi:MAG: hypothetical protein ABR575_10270 [Actinomycetota bacterium]